MSEVKLYIGNLSYHTDDESLRRAFGDYGTVVDSIVMVDRLPCTPDSSPLTIKTHQDSGRSRGFGFVTLSSDAEAEAAIAAWNDQDLDGRRIRVSKAQPKSSGGGGTEAEGAEDTVEAEEEDIVGEEEEDMEGDMAVEVVVEVGEDQVVATVDGNHHSFCYDFKVLFLLVLHARCHCLFFLERQMHRCVFRLSPVWLLCRCHSSQNSLTWHVS
ncbi:uncharacterized protein EI90DRAFT_1334952 [Cantharellus anzutake]|uniref:uncharacterized protein n=1 Tax=Cantharellus anzutake TaxID=1750568 RepID=UPI00190593FD|nr:uncharacterized protein EI90DRAFT_1334952 [Cantharellus anzutake]KAF8329693.1 hypothetical protein EI90DRAFT_1334952 [Cantharellus anzutake]